jgi:hypothetical protein
VFLVFNLLQRYAGASAYTLFISYAVCLVGLLISGQVFFGVLDRAAAAVQSASPQSDEMVNPHEEQMAPNGFRKAVQSPRFLYLVILCAIGILRLNFVVLTINTQLSHFFDSDEAGTLSTVFSSLLPWGGLAAPLTAYLLDHHRRWSYRITLGLSIVYGLCLAVPSASAQILAYVIIAVSRQLTYTIVFSLTSSLFGQEHLGKLLALNNLAVFTVGLAQYPIAAAVGGPLLPSWTAADLLMTAIALPLLLSNGGLLSTPATTPSPTTSPTPAKCSKRLLHWKPAFCTRAWRRTGRPVETCIDQEIHV